MTRRGPDSIASQRPQPALGAIATPSVRRLVADLTKLRADIAAEGETTLALWNPALRRPEFRPAAANLAHYLALRRRDLRSIQTRLSQLGLTSLGQVESRVLPAIDAILGTLAIFRERDRSSPSRTRVVAHESGQRAISREQNRIFGADPHGPRTRIMVTMPTEAATDGALVARMLAAGADCARINCAHDDPDVWLAIIKHVRTAARALGRRCPILMDLAGPKVRLTAVTPAGKVRLVRGDRFELVAVPAHARDSQVSAVVSHAEVVRALTEGATVWIDDGKIGARVVSIDQQQRATLEVVSARDRGERLRAEKGINLPGADLAIPPLSSRDRVDLDFVAEHADVVGYSFVQRPEDLRLLQRELRRRRPGRPLLPVVLKVETALAVRNLPRLIVAAGGRQPVAVMIARGDLAVEIGLGRLSEIQEQILWICEAAHVPVVWATQVLERLVKDGAASRGEATDAAMGQRAECVMLNKGPHQVEAIAFLDDILRRMDRHQHKRSPRLAALRSWDEPQTLNDPTRRVSRTRPNVGSMAPPRAR